MEQSAYDIGKSYGLSGEFAGLIDAWEAALNRYPELDETDHENFNEGFWDGEAEANPDAEDF